jgi:MYND finger
MSSDDEKDVELRVFIECDGGCGWSGQTRPLKWCARCHCTFYCSVECQGNHWRQEHRDDCREISFMRAQPEHSVDGALPQRNETTSVSVNT